MYFCTAVPHRYIKDPKYKYSTKEVVAEEVAGGKEVVQEGE